MSARAPKVGELFAGYGGLGLAVKALWPNADLAWYSDVCKFNKDGSVGHYEPHRGPCRVMGHRHPDVPNLGDVAAVDWASVEPVDILTGGSPCQDLSHAGKRAGMTDGTRSNLWVAMREAIATLRPGLVIWENVRGAYSAAADSALEPCPGCMGEPGNGQPVLRALGRVLGDLSELGYDAAWVGLRAADVGAAHGRYRVFVIAWPVAADTDDPGRGELWRPVAVRPEHAPAERGGAAPADGVALFPTPAVNDMGEGKTLEWWDDWAPRQKAADGRPAPHGKSLAIEAQRVGDLTRADVFNGVWEPDERGVPGVDLRAGAEPQLLPTPRATDGTKGGPNQRGSSGDLMLPSAVNLLPTPVTDPDSSNGHARNLGAEARLLQTPSAADATGGHERRGGSRDDELLLNGQAKAYAAGLLLPTPMVGSTNPAAHGQISGDYRTKMTEALARWGDYGPAIHRWETVLGRPAPSPTQTGTKGNPQLAPAFTEWLMGLPAGHITDVPGITRNEALKLCGNGVVPQQATEAVRWLLGHVVGSAGR